MYTAKMNNKDQREVTKEFNFKVRELLNDANSENERNTRYLMILLMIESYKKKSNLEVTFSQTESGKKIFTVIDSSK